LLAGEVQEAQNLPMADATTERMNIRTENPGTIQCDYCEKMFEKIEYCIHCKKAKYCSRFCKLSAWKGGHKEICRERCGGFGDKRSNKEDELSLSYVMLVTVIAIAVIVGFAFIVGSVFEPEEEL